MADFHYNIATGHDGGGDEYKYLYWTTEPPTKPGWYWAIHKQLGKIVVEAFRHNEGGELYFCAGWEDYFDSDFTHWLGPLPEPEASK